MTEDKQVETILAQWQTCVEMANSISQRRDTMNNIFMTANLALIAAVSITFDVKSVFLLVAGIVLCVLWIHFISNYKLLNKAKFNVIMELERKLPEKPFTDEWKGLKDTERYKEGTLLERVLPWMFMLLYFVMILVIIIPAVRCNCRCGG